MNNPTETLSVTVPVYYDEPYLTELDSKVLQIEQKGSQHVVELESTIFIRKVVDSRAIRSRLLAKLDACAWSRCAPQETAASSTREN